MVDLSIHCCVDLRKGIARGGSLDRKLSASNFSTTSTIELDKHISDQSDDVTMVTAKLSKQSTVTMEEPNITTTNGMVITVFQFMLTQLSPRAHQFPLPSILSTGSARHRLWRIVGRR